MTMNFSQMVLRSVGLWCLVLSGQGLKCYKTKNVADPEIGGFDKSKLEEYTCVRGEKYCGTVGLPNKEGASKTHQTRTINCK